MLRSAWHMTGLVIHKAVTVELGIGMLLKWRLLTGKFGKPDVCVAIVYSMLTNTRTLVLLYMLITGSQTMQYFIPTLVGIFGWEDWEGQCKLRTIFNSWPH